MTPEEARHQAKALLNATDAMLAGLLSVATQLRETVALMVAAVDHTEVRRPALARPLPPVRVQEAQEHNGDLLPIEQLMDSLKLAGVDIARATIENYTTRKVIPCTLVGHRRMYSLPEVLETLAGRSRLRKPQAVAHSPEQ